MSGKVYIIGVGPGDYGLITLKAAKCIGKADVVVYDRLINTKILKLAKKEAELVYVGKTSGRHAVPQEGINSILVEKALEGKIVARVKGGDPFVFGRGGEEAERLKENGIEYEVVPGITSAVAVPAYAGIPVTHRDHCSSLHIITGHEKPGKENSGVDYRSLAGLKGTLVFLMGVANLPNIAGSLMENGKESSTPAAVVENGTTSMQRSVTGTLGDIVEKVRKEGIGSPAVIVIGDVVRLSEGLRWFPRGRLAGKRLLVTRTREQAGRLAEKIEELGGEAIEFPTIEIKEPDSFQELDSAIERLQEYKWLVFTSINGVKAFFTRMRQSRIDIRRLAGLKVAAVGESTAAELLEYGINTDFIPGNHTSADLLDGLKNLVVPGEKVLAPRSQIADPELINGFGRLNLSCDDVIAYRTIPALSGRDELIELLEPGSIDAVTFTSASTVKNFVSILGEENLQMLSGTRLVCIGPVTAKAAEESGLSQIITSERHTIDGMIDKLIEIFQ